MISEFNVQVTDLEDNEAEIQIPGIGLQQL